jgi:hypothetical protein
MTPMRSPRQQRRYLAWLWSGLVLFVGSCCTNSAMQCQFVDGDCERRYQLSAGSICIFDGVYGNFCAEPDSGCEAGYRWTRWQYSDHACDCIDPALLRSDGGTGAD